jgi:hypothetical protein
MISVELSTVYKIAGTICLAGGIYVVTQSYTWGAVLIVFGYIFMVKSDFSLLQRKMKKEISELREKINELEIKVESQ